jgi:beta-lactam-binding protein with PASTA domain
LPLAGLPAGEPGRDSNPTALAGLRPPTGNGRRRGPSAPRPKAEEPPSVLADPAVLALARGGGDPDDESTVVWHPDAGGGPPTQALPIAGPTRPGVYDREADVGPIDADRRAAIDAAADAAAEWGAEADRARLDDEFDAMIAGGRARSRGQNRSGNGSDPEQQWNAGAEAGWSGSPAAGWEEDEPSWDEGGGTRRHWLRWVVAALVLFLLSGGGAVAWIETHQPTPPSVVPSLTGDTEAHARQVLAKEHLVLEIAGRTYDAHAAKGTILSGQAPGAGRDLRRGESVAVTVSRGPQPVKVPSLKGLTRYRAHQLLAEVGLKIDKISRTTSTTVPTDRIISSTPSSGTLLPGQGVTIVISTGKPSISVPLLSGATVQSYAAASAALQAQHFVPSEELVYSTTVPKGEVVDTSPAPHATVLWGSPITVLVSKGPDLVPVPDVKGLTVADADARLTSAGFVVSGVTGNPSRKVIGTDPAIGTPALFGSDVQILTAGSSHKSHTGHHSHKG